MKKWLAILITNLVLVAIIAGGILFTLTYQAVPVEAQHLWFGTNLHDYLVFTHATTLGIGLLTLLVANIVLFIKN